MKKLFFGISVFNLLGFLIVSFLSFSTRPRIAYVDSARLVNEYEGMKEARKAFSSKAALWNGNIDSLASEVQKESNRFDSTGSANEHNLISQSIKNKEKLLLDYTQAVELKAQQMEAEMTAEVLAEINTFLKSYGNENGYEIILGSDHGGNIVYANDRNEITEDILIRLNAQYISP